MYETAWNLGTWTLDELQLLLPPGASIPKLEDDGIGRNNSLFKSLLSWRGRPGNWHAALEETFEAAVRMNTELQEPLDVSELRGIAKSANAFIDAKVASGEQQEGLLGKASRCGIASGLTRRAKTRSRNLEWKKRHDDGETFASIARSAGMTDVGVSKAVKRLEQEVVSIAPVLENTDVPPHYLISSVRGSKSQPKREEDDLRNLLEFPGEYELVDRSGIKAPRYCSEEDAANRLPFEKGSAIDFFAGLLGAG